VSVSQSPAGSLHRHVAPGFFLRCENLTMGTPPPAISQSTATSRSIA
jgi:hypothetical protein